MKEFADNNFKFDENGKKLSKQVENTVGKGEIALYEQFLLFQQCFQKACFPEASKGVIVWEGVNLKMFSISLKRISSVMPAMHAQKISNLIQHRRKKQGYNKSET